MTRLIFSVAVSLAIQALPILANAGINGGYSISPMQAVLKLENGTSLKYTLSNHGEKPVSVALEVFERTEKNGKERRAKTEDFKFDQQRLELAPGQTVIATGEYRGKKILGVERAFRIIAKQLPSAKVSGSLRLSYEASLFVGTQSMKPNLQMRVIAKNGDTSFDVEAENSGTAHQSLSGLELYLRDSENSKEEKLLLLDGATKEAWGKQTILPRTKRRLRLGFEGSDSGISSLSFLRVNRAD